MHHGLGWFLTRVQGHDLAWHTGLWEQRYSALYVKVLGNEPASCWTLILLANSDGLQWPSSLDEAVPERSPFVRAFLALAGTTGRSPLRSDTTAAPSDALALQRDTALYDAKVRGPRARRCLHAHAAGRDCGSGYAHLLRRVRRAGQHGNPHTVMGAIAGRDPNHHSLRWITRIRLEESERQPPRLFDPPPDDARDCATRLPHWRSSAERCAMRLAGVEFARSRGGVPVRHPRGRPCAGG